MAVLASDHPSAILRARDEDAAKLRAMLIKDLATAQKLGAS
jgi:hypothetical protein